MILQLVALLGIAGLVYRHEHRTHLRHKSQVDALRRQSNRRLP